jgi:hypothetical protein
MIMLQTVVGLAFASLVLNAMGYFNKNDKAKKKIFVTVEIMLVAVLVIATIYANK